MSDKVEIKKSEVARQLKKTQIENRLLSLKCSDPIELNEDETRKSFNVYRTAAKELGLKIHMKREGLTSKVWLLEKQL